MYSKIYENWQAWAGGQGSSEWELCPDHGGPTTRIKVVQPPHYTWEVDVSLISLSQMRKLRPSERERGSDGNTLGSAGTQSGLEARGQAALSLQGRQC